jgi:hypothetical protein
MRLASAAKLPSPKRLLASAAVSFSPALSAVKTLNVFVSLEKVYFILIPLLVSADVPSA